MSASIEIDVTCRECGEEYRGTIWNAIHAREDPELRGLLLGGELNILICPKCSRAAYQDHFVLYQDPAAELVAYIYPPAQSPDAEFLRTTMRTAFGEAQKIYPPKDRKDYEPILVFGLAAFVEMMHAEDARAEQSQIAEAICKDQHIPFTVLRPSEARRLAAGRVLPGARSDLRPSREDVIAGLDKLLAANPALMLYAGLRSAIDADPAWKIGC